MRGALLAVVVVIVSSLAGTRADAAGPMEAHVVKLFASKRQVDPSSPWQFESVRQQSSLAVLVAGDRLLTTAFAVADATLVEMQQFGASRRDEVEVVFVDYEVNLAVLRPKATRALTGLKAVELGDDLAVDDAVEIYKPRDAYQLARLPASLQEVGVFAAVTSSYSLVSYLLKVQQTGLGWSEPVFRQGRLVALTTGQDNDFVHAIPMSIVRHFLSDKITTDGYRGFPAAALGLSSLVSPEMRRLLKADGFEHGVRISEVSPAGPFAGKLQTDDVLLEVAGVQVSEHGYYSHPKWGKVHLKHLLNQRYGGDVLAVKVLRAGAPLLVSSKLTRFDSNAAPVAAYRFDTAEPHLIFGGLIFQELTQEYLKQWGKDWRDTAPLDLLYTNEYEDLFEVTPGERFVFLNRILADEVNRGYGDLRRMIVDTVNDRPVRSMASLREALAHPVTSGGRTYARIRFVRDGGEVILGYEGLAAAHARIARTYSVTSIDSFLPAPN